MCWTSKLIQDVKSEYQLSEIGKAAWKSLKNVTTIFLGGGNRKSENYRDVVTDLVQSYKTMERNTSLKVHFLDYNLDFFLGNLGALNDKRGQQFQQDISAMEIYNRRNLPDHLSNR